MPIVEQCGKPCARLGLLITVSTDRLMPRFVKEVCRRTADHEESMAK